LEIRLSGAPAAIARAALPLLRRLDPELAHDLGLAALKCVRPLWSALPIPASLAAQSFGLKFVHPLGLAAGFDKNGDYLDALGALGFSHIELGTVTPRPQAGNPKPRMFRIPGSDALINRMGFNNKGVDHLVARLARASYRGIRGISIGKNFDTPIENAHDDYVACLRKVYPHADYVAVNVSSPNTERLRELQAREGLQRILGTLLEERLALQQRFTKRVPLLVKVAPDLSPEQLSALAYEVRSMQLDGVIATNTSTDLSLLERPPGAELRGGLSGAPLHPASVKIISQLRAELGADFPIIGVGGIVSAEHARSSVRAGANLLQIYTGFAYRGAALIEEILAGLAA
jgi:dihydroorotate dehydrogenase